MADMNYLAALAHAEDMTSQSEWARVIKKSVQDVLDVIEAPGGVFIDARQAATFALIEVAASFAVHDVEALHPDGDPDPEAVEAAIANLELAIRIALKGELVAHDLIDGG